MDTHSSAGIAIGPSGSCAKPLPSWIDLLCGVANETTGKPTVILLPEVELVGETVAILCAREFASRGAASPETILGRLRDGSRVRVLPDDGIYEFGGIYDNGFWLQPFGARNGSGRGRFWIKKDVALRLEPTCRKRPIGKPNRHAWSPIKPTPWDHFSGSTLCGNAALGELSVVLIGSRADFAGSLKRLAFAVAPGGVASGVAEGLPWGQVDEDGELELLYPPAASGTPLIAVARDHVSARHLAERCKPGTLHFISVRQEDALANRTSVEVLAERHRCLLLAPGRMRQEFQQRQSYGWLVTELSGLSVLRAKSVGINQLDRISASSRWMGQKPGNVAMSCPELYQAFRLLDSFNRAAAPHLEEDEELNEASNLLGRAFFEASEWLLPPSEAERGELIESQTHLLKLLPRLRSIAGADAAEAASEVFASLLQFAEVSSGHGMTPKGECLRHLADEAKGELSSTQIIVTARRRTAGVISSFLKQFDLSMTCITPAELGGVENVSCVNVVSVMRREAFARVVDPWPAPKVVFLGYLHEVELYKQRLTGRQKLIDHLRSNAPMIAKLPELGALETTGPTVPLSDSVPSPLEQLTDASTSVRRPHLRPGEQSKGARFCRFVGRSWMPMTDDHAVARLQAGNGQKGQMSTVVCRDLQVGDLIVVREGGEKDIVREMAEQIAGTDKYELLRKKADHWHRALKSSGHTPEEMRKVLASEGLDRGLATLRYWMSDKGPIGPNNPDSALPIIAAAVGKGAEGQAWDACLKAIQSVRRLHVHAGFELTRMLIQDCGNAVIQHAEHETAFELAVGTVWLLEIEHLETDRQQWPYHQVNKLQWESDTWRSRLMRNRSFQKYQQPVDDLLTLQDTDFVLEDL